MLSRKFRKNEIVMRTFAAWQQPQQELRFHDRRYIPCVPYIATRESAQRVSGGRRTTEDAMSRPILPVFIDFAKARRASITDLFKDRRRISGRSTPQSLKGRQTTVGAVRHRDVAFVIYTRRCAESLDSLDVEILGRPACERAGGGGFTW